MAVAKFKDLCIDAGDSEELGRFWAAALGLTFQPDGGAGVLVGDRPEKRVWMNVVPEAKSVKHRVHLDVHAGSIAELEELGARVETPADPGGRHWTVMLDPEGGEFCAFVREPGRLPDYRLYEVVVDCAEPRLVAEYCGYMGRTIRRSMPERISSSRTEATDGLPTCMPKRTGTCGRAC